MTIRTYPKTVLIETLKDSINESIPDILLTVVSTVDHVTLTLNRDPSPAEDVTLQAIVNANLPTDSFVDEKRLTDQRNVEGFELYKKIFAHISDNDAVSNIDSFIIISEFIHKLRNFLKDGNFETAVRYFYVYVRPLNAFDSQELYRTWIREISLKYNPILATNCGLLNPAFVGTPFENVPYIDYIEQAPDGTV
jgi:hypothetical protein